MSEHGGIGPGGRPTNYRKEFVQKAYKHALAGGTDIEIADSLGISVRSLYEYRNEYPEFAQSLKAGKEEADLRVERSMYQRAIGYEQDAIKIFMPAGASEPVYAPYREKIAPDTTAGIFWLKNRKPAEWRDKVDVNANVSGEVIKRVIRVNI